MKNNGLSFTDWWNSGHNPMRGASQIAMHFSHDAMRAAFDAGQLYHARLLREARQRERNEPSNFTFEEPNASQ